jgi:branched-subunit amino acid transport protein
MKEIILILGMALVTFGVRYPVLAVVGRIDLPQPVLRALKYVPVAVLTAITTTAVLIPQDEIWISYANAYLVGAIAAVLIAWRTRNLLLTIVLGMAIFLLWRAIVG